MTAVVVPAHNEETNIAGVLSAIGAAPSTSDVVIVANGCTDQTAQVAGQFGRVVVTDVADKGTAMALGLAQVTDPLVTFIDADVVGLLPGHVELLGTAGPLEGMVVGLDDSWGTQSGLPPITGERRLPSDFARSIGLAGTGYRAELLIDAAVAEAGLPHAHYILVGMKNPRRPWRHPLMLADLGVVALVNAPALIRYVAQRSSTQ